MQSIAMPRVVFHKFVSSEMTKIVVLTTAMFLACITARQFLIHPEVLEPIWPAIGVLLYALLHISKKYLPIAVGAALLANAAGNYATDMPLGPSILFALVNCIAASCCAIMIMNQLGSAPRFNNLRNLLILLVYGVGIGNAVGATLGALLTVESTPGAFSSAWVIWWLSNALGILVVVPFASEWRYPSTPLWGEMLRLAAEGGILTFALVIAAVLGFGRQSANSSIGIALLIFPLVVWVGMRFGMRGASIAATATTILVLFFAGHTYPDLMGFYSASHPKIVELQMFMVMAVMSALIPSAALADRQRSEAALRESEAKFRTVAENARAVFGIVQGRHFVYVNPYLEKLSGYSAEEICEMDISDLIHPESRAMVLDYARRRQAGESVPQHYEFAMVTKSGEKRWMDFTPALINYEGEPAIVGTAFDVTERKLAQEALVRTEKLASVGRMAATVAHEINNPLAAIMNSLFIARTMPDLQAAIPFLDTADEELKRVAHLTRQALGFYKESVNPSDVQLAEIMDSTMDLLKSKMKAKHVHIVKDYELETSVTAVAGEMRQVFSNLLANSLEAISEKGTVRVRIKAVHHPKTGADCVRITVADDGLGIPVSAKPHIFEPLFTTREGVGTGLGLWVTGKIVEKHHGSIRVHSKTRDPFRGTSFSITLPKRIG